MRFDRPVGRARPRLWRALAVCALSTALLPIPLSAQTAGISVAAASTIPDRLDDQTFWSLVSSISEPGGSFRSDNFVSNELSSQWVIPDLLRTTKTGGVYLGVGPDQNFTYIVALQPRISFIFDIRRQNMLTHLMYKALIEASPSRAEFLSLLFARPRPAGLDSTSTPEALLDAYERATADSTLYRATLAAINDRLMKQHGFQLSADDLATIAYVYGAFVEAGPDITYNFAQRGGYGGYGGYGRGRMPTYSQLMVATDSERVHRSYLATEANFDALRAAELDNRIVPVVGDFAGPKAIRAVADYLTAHRATVTAFYLSNVEQYLFQQDDDWRRFYANASTLPIDSTSTFIRSVFNGLGYYRRQSPGLRGQQLLASMRQQLAAFKAGTLANYYDVIESSAP
jgi:hypothetical protein